MGQGQGELDWPASFWNWLLLKDEERAKWREGLEIVDEDQAKVSTF